VGFTTTISLGGTLGASTAISVAGNSLGITGLSDGVLNGATNVIMASSDGDLYTATSLAFLNAFTIPTVVYLDTTSPNTATKFSLFIPPSSDNPGLHAQIGYYYVGTDASLWTYAPSTYTDITTTYGVRPIDKLYGSHATLELGANQASAGTVGTTHQYDTLISYSGIPVFPDYSIYAIYLRYGGIYQIIVSERIWEGGAVGLITYNLYQDGSIITTAVGTTVSANSDVTAGSMPLVFTYKQQIPGKTKIEVRTSASINSSSQLAQYCAFSVVLVGFF
jgi:hypothetical protein